MAITIISWKSNIHKLKFQYSFFISPLSFNSFNIIAVEDKLKPADMIIACFISMFSRYIEMTDSIIVVTKNCKEPFKKTFFFIFTSCFTESSNQIVNIRKTIPNSAMVFNWSLFTIFCRSKTCVIIAQDTMYHISVGIPNFLKNTFSIVDIKMVTTIISNMFLFFNCYL